LFVQATGQTRFRLFAETERRYFIKWMDVQITFEPGADGRAVSLILHKNSRDEIALRIKGAAYTHQDGRNSPES